MSGIWWCPLDKGTIPFSLTDGTRLQLGNGHPGGEAMDFPIGDLLDEDACYNRLVTWIHPEGLTCPGCHQDDQLRIHRRNREPVLDYRCGHCGRVFNALTGTALQGLHYRPSTILLILRGIAQGVPTGGRATVACPHWDGGTSRAAMRRGSGRGTTTGTGFARCTTTRRKGSGRDCGTSCGRSGE